MSILGLIGKLCVGARLSQAGHYLYTRMRFPGQLGWQKQARLPLLLPSSRGILTLPGSDTRWALQLSDTPRPATAGSLRCHPVNGIIYLFMSPDVSSPAATRGGEGGEGGGEAGGRTPLWRPGARAGLGVRGRWCRGRPGAGRGGVGGTPPRDGRPTEHAPSCCQRSRHFICVLGQSTSHFSFHPESSIVPDPSRHAFCEVFWRVT